jgi:speckle-type POZ protein
VINIEGFDSETVRRMVEFLYTGDYDATPRQSEAAGPVDSSEPATSSPHCVLLPVDDGGDGVISHVRVSAIADYYDIKGLAKLSNSKIQNNRSERWDTQALADAIKESSDLTGDADLQDTIAALAAQHLNDLMENAVLQDLVSDFGLKIIRKYVENSKAVEKELRDITNRLSASVASEEVARDTSQRAVAKTVHAHENITRCLQTLMERDQCRNNKCGASFSCYIEERGHQPVYTLRCAKCRCRH